MIFNQSHAPKTIGLPYNWAAEYISGELITEYDLQTQRRNDFYSIKQGEVERFGLFGSNVKLFFESRGGHFHLNGRRVDIAYIDPQKGNFNLTNNENNKDLITYKQAYTDINLSKTEQDSHLESINFGYKTKIKKHGASIFFQPVVCLPFGKSVYIEVKVTSDIDLDGELVFYTSGKEVGRFRAPLTANKSGQINWTVK